MTPDILSAPQMRAIAALLENDDRDSAASAAQVSKRSLRRWLSQRDFLEELARQRTRLLTETATVLSRGAAGCARALVRAGMGDIAARAPQIAAAVKVIELAQKSAELDDFGRRLDAIEERARTTAPQRRTE